MQREASNDERRVHSHCLTLRQGSGAQAFAYYLGELGKRQNVAHRNVCAASCESREFEAGRLSALTEALGLMEKKYAELRPIVEVVPS